MLSYWSKKPITSSNLDENWQDGYLSIQFCHKELVSKCPVLQTYMYIQMAREAITHGLSDCSQLFTERWRKLIPYALWEETICNLHNASLLNVPVSVNDRLVNNCTGLSVSATYILNEGLRRRSWQQFSKIALSWIKRCPSSFPPRLFPKRPTPSAPYGWPKRAAMPQLTFWNFYDLQTERPISTWYPI